MKKELGRKGKEILEIKESYDNSNEITKDIILIGLKKYELSEEVIEVFKSENLDELSKYLFKDKTFLKSEDDYIREYIEEFVERLDKNLEGFTIVETNQEIKVVKKIGLSRNDLKRIGIEDNDDLFLLNFLGHIIIPRIKEETLKCNASLLKHIRFSKIYNSEKYRNLYNFDVEITYDKKEIFNKKMGKIIKDIITIFLDIELAHKDIMKLFGKEF